MPKGRVAISYLINNEITDEQNIDFTTDQCADWPLNNKILNLGIRVQGDLTKTHLRK